MKTAGIILAGGKSSRMGVNKALLEYEGARLIDYVAHELIKSDIKDIFISGQISGFNCIADPFANGGPMVGILTSIKAIHDQFNNFLVIPVDMPLINANIIRALINMPQGKEVAFFENFHLPFFMVKNPKLDEIIANEDMTQNYKDKSVKAFLSGFDSFKIATNPNIELALLNANTPLDWKNALSQSMLQTPL